jgi:hypothetical protein
LLGKELQVSGVTSQSGSDGRYWQARTLISITNTLLARVSDTLNRRGLKNASQTATEIPIATT